MEISGEVNFKKNRFFLFEVAIFHDFDEFCMVTDTL